MYRGKTSKRILLSSWFVTFFELWQRKPVFLSESFWQGCQSYFLCVQKNNYRATFQKWGLEILKVFGWFLKILGQWRKSFSGLAKQQKMSGGTVYGKYFFRWEKFAIFSDSERFSYFWRKNLPDLRKSQSTYPWKFLGKNIFWNLYNLPHLFGIWSKKRLVGNFFSRVDTTAIRASRGIFWSKVIFLRKVKFVHLFWSLSNFLLSFDKKSHGVKETTY